MDTNKKDSKDILKFNDKTESNVRFLDDEIYNLKDEEGNDVAFIAIANIEYKGKTYLLCQPENDEELSEDEGILFEINEEGGDELNAELIIVEDETIGNAVFEEYLIAVAKEEA
jgi:uncharacterized protein YrzB (UPF0473 family)